MTDITRRHALGLTGGLVSLTACAQTSTAPGALAAGDGSPAYDGQVSFEHGVASGDPLTDRVILWTRVTPARNDGRPVPVTYEVARDTGFTDLVTAGSVEAVAARDYTVKVDADGLAPGSDYHYRFRVNAADGVVDSPTGRTRTASAAGSTEPVTFAVISCSNWQFGLFNVYADIARRGSLDAVIHLGDYFYEYGIDGYGSETAKAMDRLHDPVTEIVTLADYRTRHAQYKTDPNLQAAHACAPWLCTWDDHESTNNSYRTGAQNHNPEENEGDWSDRKMAAVQAYLEWMPVRDPAPGRVASAIYRRFDFGDVATVFCLESRLTGRSEEISWFAELAGVAPAEIPARAMATMQKVADPARTMLGRTQEDWLADRLAASTSAGKAWQVLANQVIMAEVRPPDFTRTLSDEQRAAIDNPFATQMIEFSQLGMPWNLDAWDGFPAARDRLYAAAEQAGARLVTLTGDTHTAWANDLFDRKGDLRGVEFACTSVTSPGLGDIVPIEDLGQQFEAANDGVVHHDPFGRGYTLVHLTMEAAEADYVKVSTVTSPNFQATTSVRLGSRRTESGQTPLSRLG